MMENDSFGLGVPSYTKFKDFKVKTKIKNINYKKIKNFFKKLKFFF